MKKTISVILCSVLLLSCVPLAGAAANQIDTAYPTIIVAGYSASSLYLKTEGGRKQVRRQRQRYPSEGAS